MIGTHPAAPAVLVLALSLASPVLPAPTWIVLGIAAGYSISGSP